MFEARFEIVAMKFKLNKILKSERERKKNEKIFSFSHINDSFMWKLFSILLLYISHSA